MDITVRAGDPRAQGTSFILTDDYAVESDGSQAAPTLAGAEADKYESIPTLVPCN